MSEPERMEQLGLPDLGLDPEIPVDDDDDLENQSGLGKGLSAIIPQLSGLDSQPRSRRQGGGIASLIPGAGDQQVDADAVTDLPVVQTAAVDDPRADGPVAPSSDTEHRAADVDETFQDAADGHDAGAVRQLRDDLVRALLDGLVNTMRLDLCAYVHADDGAEPELFLRAPALATLGPQRAWSLFRSLRLAVEKERTDDQFDVAGLRGLVVATGGSQSTGVFALARVDDLTERERVVAERFCASFGRAVHQLTGDRLTIAGDAPVSVEIHEARDSILARVHVQTERVQRPGAGRADTRVEAVTRAVIDAAGVDAVFRYASEVSHSGEHAAVVLLEATGGGVALGSAITLDGGSSATAHAAIRAAASLAAGRSQPT